MRHRCECVMLMGNGADLAYDSISVIISVTLATHLVATCVLTAAWGFEQVLIVHRFIVMMVSYPLLLINGAILSIGVVTGFSTLDADEPDSVRVVFRLVATYFTAIVLQNIGFLTSVRVIRQLAWCASMLLYIAFTTVNWNHLRGVDDVRRLGWTNLDVVFGIWLPANLLVIVVIDLMIGFTLRFRKNILLRQ